MFGAKLMKESTLMSETVKNEKKMFKHRIIIPVVRNQRMRIEEKKETANK